MLGLTFESNCTMKGNSSSGVVHVEVDMQSLLVKDV